MPRRHVPRPVRFEFGPTVPFAEARRTLDLAALAVTGMFGRTRVDLELDASADPAGRTVDVDRGSGVGGALAAIFLKYCRCEFGAESVRLRRLPVAPVTPVPGEAVAR